MVLAASATNSTAIDAAGTIITHVCSGLLRQSDSRIRPLRKTIRGILSQAP